MPYREKGHDRQDQKVSGTGVIKKHVKLCIIYEVLSSLFYDEHENEGSTDKASDYYKNDVNYTESLFVFFEAFKTLESMLAECELEQVRRLKVMPAKYPVVQGEKGLQESERYPIVWRTVHKHLCLALLKTLGSNESRYDEPYFCNQLWQVE